MHKSTLGLNVLRKPLKMAIETVLDMHQIGGRKSKTNAPGNAWLGSSYMKIPWPGRYCRKSAVVAPIGNMTPRQMVGFSASPPPDRGTGDLWTHQFLQGSRLSFKCQSQHSGHNQMLHKSSTCKHRPSVNAFTCMQVSCFCQVFYCNILPCFSAPMK